MKIKSIENMGYTKTIYLLSIKLVPFYFCDIDNRNKNALKIPKINTTLP